MSAEIELVKYEKKLVEALATTDLLKLSKDLRRYQVITPRMMKTFASLDHERLDPRTRARYLLHLIYIRIKIDSDICHTFLTLLSEVDNVRVARIGRALVQIREDPDTESNDGTEKSLIEQDVGYLMEVLAEVSYKWEEISIALRLPKACIEEARNAKNNKLRLHSSLSEWVCGNHRQARPPTLTALTEALASDIVQLWRLAGQIEKKVKAKISSAVSPSQFVQVNDQFKIQYESTDTEVADGKSALLEVQANPRESMSYQWIKNGQPLFESSAFSGTHSAMLFINTSGQKTQGNYCCRISCGNKQLTSSVVKVTIKYHRGKKRLLDLYSHLSEVPQDSWPVVSTSTFVELSLIKATKVKNDCNFFIEGDLEDVLVTRKQIKYNKAFGKYKSGALVLIEGRPGSGKTTLAHKLTKDWANGLVLQSAHMVFLISLRNENNNSDIFKIFFQSQSKQLQREIEESSGERVCFILDGYDEYSPRLEEKGDIDKLIEKKYLPLAMIIVTSRPVATAELTARLRHKATRRIETLGFTKKQFNTYVNQFPFEALIDTQNTNQTKSKLMTYLKACTNVLNMCYLPINACIICFLYSQNLGDKLPKTETEIYESLIISIVLRKLRLKIPSARLHSLKDLHGEDKESFRKICLLAFNMTVANKQIVHELPVSLESLNNSPFRGLLTIDQTAKLYGFEDTLTFLHLTLQEYLAAYHLASLDKSQQVEVFNAHMNDNSMLTTFKFYSGITSKKYRVLHMLSIIDAEPLFYYHCAYETQEEIVCYEVMTMMSDSVGFFPGVLTPADFTAMGYVISTAPFLVKDIIFTSCLLYEDFLENNWKDKELDQTDPLSYSFETTLAGAAYSSNLCMEDMFCTHISYHCKSQYQHAKEKLDVFISNFSKKLYQPDSSCASIGPTLLESSSDILSSDSALPLANALKQCKNIQYLSISNNCKSVKTASTMATLLENCTDLWEAEIRCCMPTSSAVVLVSAFKYSKKLHKLQLNHVRLCYEGSVALAKGLTHCSNLNWLDLCKCEISPDGAEAIAAGIRHIAIKTLYLGYNHIGDRGAIELSKDFHFECLYIGHNNIGSVGITALANSLATGHCNFATIWLHSNNFTSHDMIEFAQGISYCSNLQGLNLGDNYIGAKGGAALAQGLKLCVFLQELELYKCNLGIDGMVALAEAFVCWNKLKFLQLSNNGAVTDGVTALIADGLQYLTDLEKLILSNNVMDSDCVIALAEGLKYCPSLHTLDISSNNIGSLGANALAGGLKCKDMQLINLSHNKIKSVEILPALIQFNHPQKLDLSHNNLGSTGVLCLLTELISYTQPFKLNLCDNNITKKAVKFLSTFQSRNTNLDVLLDSTSHVQQEK